MYAIIETGGKQYRVSEGQKIQVEKIAAEPETTVTLDKVLFLEGDDRTVVGKPYVEGASVTAEIVGHRKAPKILVFKYKAKKNYRKRYGHRQPYTTLLIKSIEG